MRIVAGSAKGRPLEGPKKSKAIRPTADRVRETVFNILGQWLEGQAVLDLYAGTGALGLEALSRGAVTLVMVDSDREAIGLCQQNAASLGFADQAKVLGMTVDRAVAQLGKTGQRFDLIFADPPYADAVVPRILTQVSGAGLLSEGGTLCVEHSKREEAPAQFERLVQVDQRRFGDTVITWYRHS